MSATSHGYGIYTLDNAQGGVVGNRVGGLAPSAGGVANGIYNALPTGTSMVGNLLQGPGRQVAG